MLVAGVQRAWTRVVGERDGDGSVPTPLTTSQPVSGGVSEKKVVSTRESPAALMGPAAPTDSRPPVLEAAPPAEVARTGVQRVISGVTGAGSGAPGPASRGREARGREGERDRPRGKRLHEGTCRG